MQIMLALLIVASVLSDKYGVAQTSSRPFTLAIEPVHSSVEAGSPLSLKVSMHNISDHPLDCSAAYMAGTDINFQYDVKNVQGIDRLRKSIHPENLAGSIQMCTLAPGETITSETRVSWLHDLTLPGQYRIQLRRGYLSGGKEAFVESNTVLLTVIEKKLPYSDSKGLGRWPITWEADDLAGLNETEFLLPRAG